MYTQKSQWSKSSSMDALSKYETYNPASNDLHKQTRSHREKSRMEETKSETRTSCILIRFTLWLIPSTQYCAYSLILKSPVLGRLGRVVANVDQYSKDLRQ